MHKIIKLLSFIVYPLAISLVFLGVPIEKVGAVESITLTTYYPAPYGVYNQLLANRLGVGDSNGNGLDNADLPANPGTIKISGPNNTGIEFVHDNMIQWSGGTQIQGFSSANMLAINTGVAEISGGIDVGGGGVFGGNVVGRGYGVFGQVPVPASGEIDALDFGPNLYSKLNSTYVRQDDDDWLILVTLVAFAGLIIAVAQWFSSIRYKKNVKTIDNALEKVEKLRGVEFDWKSSGKHDIGLVAEEVAEVVPEVITYEKDGKTIQGLHFQKLVGLLVEAIKEQQQEISSLKEKLQQQIHSLKEEHEQQISVLKERMAVLDAVPVAQ